MTSSEMRYLLKANIMEWVVEEDDLKQQLQSYNQLQK